MGRAALSAKGSGGDRVLCRPGGGAGAARWAPRAACCREESREKRVPGCVCVYMDVTCAYACGLRMCACLYVQHTCVCAGVYMYTVYACVRVRSVCMCVHTCMCMVYVCVYLCVCTSMRLRVLCACLCTRVCAAERRGGEKQQRQLSHCPGLPHFPAAGTLAEAPPPRRELACLPSGAAVPSEFPRVRFLAFWGKGGVE